MELTKYIRDIHDFPKKGILFKDITPLLLSPEATTEALTQLRGFFFGSLIAHQLGVGYVPVRKKGKLPYDTISMSYDLEYGTDELEIHTDAIKPGDKVLVHDDVLATGGTAEAVVKLIEKAGGQVVLVSFLMELKALGGASKLTGRNVKCLMEF